MEKKTKWKVVVFVVLEVMILGVSFLIGQGMKEEKKLAAVSEKKIDTDYTLLFDIALPFLSCVMLSKNYDQ